MRANPLLWRAMQAARRANLADAGLTPPVAGDYALTRRALIVGLGAAALLPRPARAAAGSVAIVGGGIAGLAALHHLVSAGIDARLYEARSRVGGRMWTLPANAGQPAFERGGQLVNTDHAEMHALAKEFGVALVDRKRTTHRTLVLADGRVVDETALAVGLRGIAGQIDRDAILVARDFEAHAPAVDRLSIRDYLDRHAALVPDPWVRRLLEQTSRTEYGVEPDRASALGLLFNLPVVDGQRIEVLGGSDERYVIAGGSSALTDAIAARYRDRIVTGRRVAQIAGRGPVTLTFRDRSRIAADRVIVAVPAPLTREIAFDAGLPPAWRRFVAEMETGANDKVQVATRIAPWRSTMGAGGEAWTTDAGAPSALAWEGTVRGGATETPVWTWFLGGAQCDANPMIPDCAAAFAPAQAGLEDLRVTAVDRSAWALDPLTKGAYANYPPGQLTRFAQLLWSADNAPLATPRLAFVGEHLSDAFPGYMNGAAETGRLAARAFGARV